MSTKVVINMEVLELDILRDLIARDTENDKPIWNNWIDKEDSVERTKVVRELQRHQYQRSRLSTTLGILTGE